MSDYAVPVSSPDRLRNGALSQPSDLRHQLLLHATTWPEIWSRWFEAAGVPDLQPAGEMRFQNTGFTVQAALSGLGVAMAHGPLVVDELANGKLVTPFRLALPIDRSYYLVSLPDQNRVPGGCSVSWLAPRPNDRQLPR